MVHVARAARAFVVLVAAAVLGVPGAGAQPACDDLEAPQRIRAEQLLSTSLLHDCCDLTIAACLDVSRPSRLGVRVADDVCRRVVAGQDDATIRAALARRARLMLPLARQVEFDVDDERVLGDPSAPVTVVEFADARGTHCATLTPPLAAAVVDGSLAGKVRLALQLFPLRSNPGAAEAGLAVLAAGELGALWPYTLLGFEHFDDFTVEGRGDWAQQLGLDRERFEQLVADPALTEQLVASKKLGLEAGVTATPTLFIDGRRYDGELEIGVLVDLLEEVFERTTAVVCDPVEVAP